jgi:hypothetical protein
LPALIKKITSPTITAVYLKRKPTARSWLIFVSFCLLLSAYTTPRAELECEFPPKMEEDLTHVRRKRLTTKSGLVCLEDYPYTVSIRYNDFLKTF